MTEEQWETVMKEFGRLDALATLVGEIMARMPPKEAGAAFHAAFQFHECMLKAHGFTGDIAFRNEGAAQAFDAVRNRLEHEGIAVPD